MNTSDSVVATFPDHLAAEAAVKKLTSGGLAIKSLTIVGRGYHTEEKVVGFYNAGDRVKFWGSRGAYWGGLWGLFFGGVFLTTPVFGPVIVLGFLAVALVSALEGAVVIGGLGALGAALASIGVPKDSILEYETALAADGFLVMAHGPADEITHAKAILGGANPTRLDVHTRCWLARRQVTWRACNNSEPVRFLRSQDSAPHSHKLTLAVSTEAVRVSLDDFYRSHTGAEFT